jgi:3-dehydrosphinganine reductase
LTRQVFPPDTDTPLLASENLRKPTVTKLLSESTAMVAPEAVASAALDGVCGGAVSVAVGFDGWMLATLTSGMGPAGTLGSAAVQVLTMGLWRLVALCYVQWWHRGIIARHDTGHGPHAD